MYRPRLEVRSADSKVADAMIEAGIVDIKEIFLYIQVSITCTAV